MLPPPPRGSLSERIRDTLTTGSTDALDAGTGWVPDDAEDAQLALWMLYELHYRGFDGVDDRFEWEPSLISLRRHLEDDLEQELRVRLTKAGVTLESAEGLFGLVEEHDGPSLAAYVHRHATREQTLELLRTRSLYHLKESEPQAWLVPRLDFRSKAALVELQYDEFGGGDPNKLHSHLFALGMQACGLDPSYGAYVAEVPMEALEQNNAMSLFGLNRRLRGASLGHLAAFEATSSLPCRKVAQGLERLELPEEMQHYYREHVEADAVHEQLAVRTICGALLEESPELLDDVLLGAFTCLDQEDRLAEVFLSRWEEAS